MKLVQRITKKVVAGGVGFCAGSTAAYISARGSYPNKPPEPDFFQTIFWICELKDGWAISAAIFAFVSAALAMWEAFKPDPPTLEEIGGRMDQSIQPLANNLDELGALQWAEGQQRDAQHDETMSGQADIKQEIADLREAITKGQTASGLIEDLTNRLRKRELSNDEMEQIADLYGLFLRRSSSMDETLIESAVRGISHDPDLLEKALRDVEGEDRTAIMDQAEKEVAEDRTNLAERTRRLAGFASTESLARARRLWLQATELDPAHFWQWIELSRLAQISTEDGGIEAAQRFAERALNHIDNERDRMVVEGELGKLAITRGSLHEAVSHFSNCVQSAQARCNQEPGNAGWQRDLSVSYEKLGDVEVAAGNLAAARERFEASLAIRDQLAQQEPGEAGQENKQLQRDRSVSYNKLGNVEAAAGNLAAARERFEASLAIFDRLAEQEPGNAGQENKQLQRDLSVSYNKLGDVEVAAGNLAAARERFEAGLAIADRLAQQEPGNAEWQRDLSVSYNKLGDVEVAAGNLAAARERFEADLAIADRLAQQEPGNAGWQRDLSVSYNKLGNVEVAAGNLAAARERFEADLAIADRLAQQEPGNAEWQRDLWVSSCKLGQLALQEGNPALALDHFRAAETVMAALASKWPDHPGFAADLEQVRADVRRVEDLIAGDP